MTTRIEIVTDIAAPIEAVFDLARDIGTHERSAVDVIGTFLVFLGAWMLIFRVSAGRSVVLGKR